MCLAWIYYRYNHDERPVRIWEKIMKAFSASKVETEMGEAKVRASIYLARHWVRAAREAEKGSLLAQKYVHKLERLAKSKVQTTSAFIRTNTSSITLDLWYRLDGRLEEARACFQPHIKGALQILSDDDPENDREGYFKLTFVFIAVGGDENAIAILQAIGFLRTGAKEKLEGKGGGEEGEESDEEDEDPIICFCDGPCRRRFSAYVGMAVCRYGFDNKYYDACLEMLEEGNMPLQVCSPKHEWLVVPPLEEEIGIGQLDSEVVGLDDWEKEQKKQWQV